MQCTFGTTRASSVYNNLVNMKPEHEEELKKLLEVREMYATQSNPEKATTANGHRTSPTNPDPMIFPGLYAPSGFDVLDILVRVQRRPNPRFNLGNIDSSVALVLCDHSRPDSPIVYASEPFERLTGYCQAEILGKNCRFLQCRPQPGLPPTDAILTDSEANMLDPKHPYNDPNYAGKRMIKDAIEADEECQVTLINYRKTGEQFINLLTTIPITWAAEDQTEKHYIVGFQSMAAGNIFGPDNIYAGPC